MNAKLAKVKSDLNRIFDDNLHTKQWQNAVDWVIIGLIIVSTIEVFLSTFDGISERYGAWLNAIDIFTTVFFTVEVTLRIWCADLLDPKYKGFTGRLRYCFSFYGLVDIISTYSFYLALLFPVPYAALKVLRVFRLLRVFRYMKSFRVLSEAISSKKSEMWISLQFLAIVTLILSFLLFFVEHQAQPEVYDNGWTSVVWAFMQYIGDPGSFADTPPITFWGKMIAVVVGILGIAIFAVPAGLIGSGFVEVLEEKKNREEVDGNISEIARLFKWNYIANRNWLGGGWEERWMPYEWLQTKMMLTDSEMTIAIRDSDEFPCKHKKYAYPQCFRLRAKQGTNYSKIVERYRKNRPYGFNDKIFGSNLFMIAPLCRIECCMPSFAENLSTYTHTDIMSLDVELFDKDENAFGNIRSQYYTQLEAFAADKDQPEAAKAWSGDLLSIGSGQLVLNIRAAATIEPDFVLEWGVPKGTEETDFAESTLLEKDQAVVLRFYQLLKEKAAHVHVVQNSKKEFDFEYTVAANTAESATLEVYRDDAKPKKDLIRALFETRHVSAFSLYINVDILRGEDPRYYGALQVLIETINEVFHEDMHKA